MQTHILVVSFPLVYNGVWRNDVKSCRIKYIVCRNIRSTRISSLGLENSSCSRNTFSRKVRSGRTARTLNFGSAKRAFGYHRPATHLHFYLEKNTHSVLSINGKSQNGIIVYVYGLRVSSGDGCNINIYLKLIFSDTIFAQLFSQVVLHGI